MQFLVGFSVIQKCVTLNDRNRYFTLNSGFVSVLNIWRFVYWQTNCSCVGSVASDFSILFNTVPQSSVNV